MNRSIGRRARALVDATRGPGEVIATAELVMSEQHAMETGLQLAGAGLLGGALGALSGETKQRGCFGEYGCR